MSEKDLYSEVKKRKMEALGKANIVKAVEQKGRILSIQGQYDQPDKVMNYTYAAVKDTIKPNQFNKATLSNYDLVVIGCPGNEIPSEYYIRFREFVENGGWILSTDWVLRTIIEPIFPGYISWNGEKTADTVVACEIVEPQHPFMHGVIDSLKGFKGGDESKMGPKSLKTAQQPAGMQPEFKWWLEDKSFPINIVNPQEVKVLIRSYEIQKKWKAGPVFVYFTFGKGLVAHIISHTHLQKGASKGKFASAIILTNLLDECIKFKYGLESGRPRGGYQDMNAPAGGIASSPSWEQAFRPVDENASPAPASGYGSNPTKGPSKLAKPAGVGYTPSAASAHVVPDPSQGIVPDFGGIAQAVEIPGVVDSTKVCAVCGQDFASSSGKIFECNACKAAYHEECLQQQVNLEGTCKACNKVILF
ncbi:MAG TPA: hypothetical protein VKM55_14195 [Candidatus Lokiarchaeia archaeon]|nr:hypothetical protein [Candidatus Lokiarchaeia archaeon]